VIHFLMGTGDLATKIRKRQFSAPLHAASESGCATHASLAAQINNCGTEFSGIPEVPNLQASFALRLAYLQPDTSRLPQLRAPLNESAFRRGAGLVQVKM